MFGNRLLELVDPIGIPEQIELVETSADRTLQTAEWVASKEFLDPLEPDHRLFATSANRLPRVVAWAATLWVRATITSPAWRSASDEKRARRSDETVAHDLERSPDLELLDVLGEIREVIPRWMCS